MYKKRFKYKYTKKDVYRLLSVPNIRVSLVQHFPDFSKFVIIYCR